MTENQKPDPCTYYWEYEEEHLAEISDEVEDRLIKTETAAGIVANGLSLGTYDLRKVSGVIFLLYSRIAKNLLFVTKGLRLGYYSGTSGILRSTLEDLATAVYFFSQPSRLTEWWINEFLSSGKRQSAQEGFNSNARFVLFNQERNCITKIEMDKFRVLANHFMHTTIEGLAEEFHIPLKKWAPLELIEELKKSESFKEGLKRETNFDFKPTKTNSENDDIVVDVEILGGYHPGLLDFLSIAAFFIAHRLLDNTAEFLESSVEEFDRLNAEWHSDL